MRNLFVQVVLCHVSCIFYVVCIIFFVLFVQPEESEILDQVEPEQQGKVFTVRM